MSFAATLSVLGNSTIVNAVAEANTLSTTSSGINAFCSSLNASYASFADLIAVTDSGSISSPILSATGISTIANVVTEANTLSTTSSGINSFCSGVKASYASFADLIAVAFSALISSSIASAAGISITATIVAEAYTLSTASSGTKAFCSGLRASYAAFAFTISVLLSITISSDSGNSTILNTASVANRASFLS